MKNEYWNYFLVRKWVIRFGSANCRFFLAAYTHLKLLGARQIHYVRESGQTNRVSQNKLSSCLKESCIETTLRFYRVLSNIVKKLKSSILQTWERMQTLPLQILEHCGYFWATSQWLAILCLHLHQNFHKYCRFWKSE